MKTLVQGFDTAAQDLSRESEALPLSHCALRVYQISVAPFLLGWNQYFSQVCSLLVTQPAGFYLPCLMCVTAIGLPFDFVPA